MLLLATAWFLRLCDGSLVPSQFILLSVSVCIDTKFVCVICFGLICMKRRLSMLKTNLSHSLGDCVKPCFRVLEKIEQLVMRI